jgi:hypothetical protein
MRYVLGIGYVAFIGYLNPGDILLTSLTIGFVYSIIDTIRDKYDY